MTDASYNIQYEFLLDKESLKNLLSTNKLTLTKQYGQNFLIDSDIRYKLSLFIPSNHPILEIGSGVGHFTLFLLARTSILLGVELDSGFFKILNSVFQDQASFLLQDILEVAPETIYNFFRDTLYPPIVVGNIPYYITKNIILYLLSFFPFFDSIFLLVDINFFHDKLKKNPESQNLNPLYCLITAYYDISILQTVPKNSFFPSPQYHSIFIKLKAKSNPVFKSYNKQYAVFINKLFNYKNKKLPYTIDSKKNRVAHLTNEEIQKLWEDIKN